MTYQTKHSLTGTVAMNDTTFLFVSDSHFDRSKFSTHRLCVLPFEPPVFARSDHLSCSLT